MITGRLEGDHDDPALIIERDFAASVEEVWSAITDPDQLALWYGTWSGEPASGEVTVQMLFEEGEHQAVWFIDQCDPPSLSPPANGFEKLGQAGSFISTVSWTASGPALRVICSGPDTKT